MEASPRLNVNKDTEHRLENNLKQKRKDNKSIMQRTKYPNIYQQIKKSTSTSQIQSILSSFLDLDEFIYKAAIEKSGKLGNFDYCMEIMDLMKKCSINVDIYALNILCQAFTLNDRIIPKCFEYINKLVNEHHIQPDAVTVSTLLRSCIKNGDVDRAEKIWNDILRKYNIEPTPQCLLAMIQIYGNAGDVRKARSYYFVSKKNM